MVNLKCRHCQSENIVRNGKTENGKQRCFCHDCRKMSRDNPPPNGYTAEERAHILRAYRERSSLRRLTRTFGVARNTVTMLAHRKKELMPPLAATLVLPASAAPVVELDELWSFVAKRADKRWIWIALCRQNQTSPRVRGRRPVRSDVPKTLAANSGGFSSGALFLALLGSVPASRCRPHSTRAVGKESGETAHVERLNNPLRQRLARLVGKTLSFSKSDVMHETYLFLFLHRYNTKLALFYG